MKKTYTCDGITTRQNNEPAGDQHAFHFHFHIFPRYKDDGFNKAQGTKRSTTPAERKEYTDKLRDYLDSH
jgi:histidine triad (HIT) family protein